MKVRRVAPVCTLAFLMGIGACESQSEQQTADLVFKNGYVYVSDEARTVHTAIAVKGNLIVATGNEQDVMDLVGEQTEVIDLQGKMVLPGLHDMHVHALGVVRPNFCDLDSQVLSLDALVEELQTCLDLYGGPPGTWMPVVQWNPFQGNETSDRYPTIRSALDAVSSEHPIILWGNDGHHGAANSMALASVQPAINAETISSIYAEYQPFISVDGDGEPNGQLTEDARLLIREDMHGDMLGSFRPPQEVMPRVARMLASRGITSIQDPAVSTPEFAHYIWLAENGDMTFRARTAILIGGHNAHFDTPADAIDYATLFRERAADSEYLEANGVKIFIDGVMEGNPRSVPPTLPNAASIDGYKQPLFNTDAATGALDVVGYVDLDSELCRETRSRITEIHPEAFRAEHGFFPTQCTKVTGRLEAEPNILEGLVLASAEAGFHVHVHAIADRAVQVTADIFESAKSVADESGVTLSVAHLQLGRSEDYRRLGELGVYVVFTYLWAEPYPDYEMTVIPFVDTVDGANDLYNPDHYYLKNAYPFRSMDEYGAKLVFGSDAPVGSRDPIPFQSMQIALTRQPQWGGDIVLNSQERIDIHTALASFTRTSAELMQHEDRLGTLETGKVADLIVIDQNVVELAESGQPDKIGATQVLMTVFDGEIVFNELD